jgi:chemotaxis protein CheC
MEEAQINEKEITILKEVASIGMGNASMALEQLLSTKINISLPEIEMIQVKDITRFFPGEEILLGVVIKIFGDIKGKLLYLFKKNDAQKMIGILIQKYNSSKDVDISEEVSTIKKMANIMSGSYLNALSSFVSISVLPSLPHLAMDTAASIFDLASLSEEETSQLILIRSKLTVEDKGFETVGSLVIELRHDQLRKLIDLIKTKYGGEI